MKDIEFSIVYSDNKFVENDVDQILTQKSSQIEDHNIMISQNIIKVWII